MKRNSAITGAAFLMATSAIGPGFLTQTSFFTAQLFASFGFVILISVLLDIGAQLNIWRIITMSENRAQDIANKIFPGLGFLLAILIAFGGLVFNIGNIAGAGLGINVLTGIDVKTGAMLSCFAALFIFWNREAGKMIDTVVKILGLVMIGLTIYIAISSRPPLAEAFYRTVWPAKTDLLMIVTLVGGTVGGYISFAGAHRLMDAGIKGTENLVRVNKSAVTGILITSFMRFILFIAVLGVVATGIQLSAGNPAASVFQSAAGKLGYNFFGVVLWSAALTSVIGASFTSVSFWKTLNSVVEKHEKIVISCFIIVSTVIFIVVGNPVKLLILAGAVNGLILPVALAIILIAANKSTVVHQYRHPLFLQLIGWMVVILMIYMGYITIQQSVDRFF
jgi:Mn2+/Fe2+ NRAMP family transporter